MQRNFFLSIMMIVISPLLAQESKNEFEIQYTTEEQYNFKSKFNWVNLLRFEADLSTEALGGWKNGFIHAELISIYKTSKDRIADDLQMFSNIEEDNLLLGIFTLGYTHRLSDRLEVFAGIRNVNKDYFATPYTSLFTNSSCGIYPTLSSNFPIANYPLSAMCLHAEYQPSENILLKNTLYNGVAKGYGNKYGHLFGVLPQRDGVFNISELSYINNKKNHGIYNMGIAVHSGLDHYSEILGKKKKMNYSFWGHAEQAVYKKQGQEIGLMVQGGYAPSDRNDCSAYYGIGTVLSGFVSKERQDRLGFVINRAVFSEKTETAVEISWEYPVCKSLTIQPTLDYIVTAKQTNVIALMRVTYTLSIF